MTLNLWIDTPALQAIVLAMVVFAIVVIWPKIAPRRSQMQEAGKK